MYFPFDLPIPFLRIYYKPSFSKAFSGMLTCSDVILCVCIYKSLNLILNVNVYNGI